MLCQTNLGYVIFQTRRLCAGSISALAPYLRRPTTGASCILVLFALEAQTPKYSPPGATVAKNLPIHTRRAGGVTERASTDNSSPVSLCSFEPRLDISVSATLRLCGARFAAAYLSSLSAYLSLGFAPKRRGTGFLPDCDRSIY